jgi:hypothetical protein
MDKKKALVNSLVKSLAENHDEWRFGRHTAENKRTGIEIWTANIPLLDICLHHPVKVRLSICDRVRIYRAIEACKVAKAMAMIEKTGSA